MHFVLVRSKYDETNPSNISQNSLARVFESHSEHEKSMRSLYTSTGCKQVVRKKYLQQFIFSINIE